ncbi:MAG TPA: hypothetical protein VFW87_12380 [Pirellulales bacterium]|nr:hypothetical protein [Pirellulales bacterium]
MASDVLNEIDADFQSRLDNDNPVEWMIAALVPMRSDSGNTALRHYRPLSP